MGNELLSINYVQLPNLDAAGTVAMATGLVAGIPKDAPPALKKAGRAVANALETLKAVIAGAPVESQDDKRPADLALDRAWAGAFGRISSYAMLPEEHYPKVSKANELLQALFPEGLTFLKLPYRQEWAESESRLERIGKLGLEAAFTEIAGRDHLEQVRRTHAVYGEVLGITKPNPLAQAPERAEKVRAVRRTMNHYVLNVLAVLDEDDKESVEMVRRALQPIDEFRAANNARRSSNNSEADETDPSVPSVPGPEVVVPSNPSAPGAAVPISVRPAPSDSPN